MLQLYPMDSMCSVPEYPKAAETPGASFAVDGLARRSKTTVERRAHLSTSFGALLVLASPPAQLVLLLCCAPWQAAAPAAASSLLLGSANAVADSAAGAATAALRTCASSGDRAQCGWCVQRLPTHYWLTAQHQRRRACIMLVALSLGILLDACLPHS
jgi:hypothetical protein